MLPPPQARRVIPETVVALHVRSSIPSKMVDHSQYVLVVATTAHMTQMKNPIQTLRRKASPSAPSPGIRSALNGSLKGACVLLLLSRVLMRISFTAPVAAQKKPIKPMSTLDSKMTSNIWAN